MIRRPPRSTLSSSSAASDVYKRQVQEFGCDVNALSDSSIYNPIYPLFRAVEKNEADCVSELISLGANVNQINRDNGFTALHIAISNLSLIHISEPTRLLSISYAVFCLKKKKQEKDISIGNKIKYNYILNKYKLV
eukprot:TRINITY_DN45969_c0_g1_i1.p1 TRINITY_DN45969_c0_g1~~TRINITY_DN45969_c0_g1_i1.p1  ORF type:complete len:136 (+),score=26.41 TRINITY_DN45969_c0_g1_i1:127-534(+)